MDIPYGELASIAICLVFSGFFSASETALTSLPDIKVQQMLDAKRFWIMPLSLWQKHPNRVLVTILIGNNLANITASVLATDIANLYFEEQGIPVAIGVMTFVLLFTGEITPKTLARTFPTAVAIPAIWILYGFYVLFFPLTIVLTYFVRILISMLGARTDQAKIVTEKDLEYVVRMGADTGAFDEDQESLFQSVIEFTDTLAKQIMVPRTDVISIALDSSYEKVVETAIESGLSRIPVYQDSIDNVVGIFYAKNLISPPTEDEKDEFISKRMRPPEFVPESKKISEILKLFQEKKTHIAIVVDEFGGTEGLVTLEDVVEELLGEIQDEFDLDDQRLVAIPNGGYMADARVDLDELEDALDTEFEEDRHYESLGGLLMEAAGTVPVAGWELTRSGYSYTVMEADANRIIKVKIVPLESINSVAEETAEPLPADPETGDPS